MGWEPIRKHASPGVRANLADYDRAVREFSWDQARAELDGLPGGRGLNIAHEAVDRHAAGARRNAVALRCVGQGRHRHRHHLRRAAPGGPTGSPTCSVTWASAAATGCSRCSAGIPELYVAALGTLKNTSVFSPLFSAFGPEPIRERMRARRRRVLVTTAELYQRKVAPIRAAAAGAGARAASPASRPTPGTTWPGAARWPGAADEFEIPPTDPEDMALLHFTSGTTGQAQGRGARARGGRRPPRDRRVRARPAPRRRVLVHRRPGLGHRHVVRHHRAAHPRRRRCVSDAGEFDARALVPASWPSSGSPSGTRRRPRCGC